MFPAISLASFFSTLIHISRDSAATHLGCGEIFSNRFTAHFPQSVTVKKFVNLSIFGEEEFAVTFWPTMYYVFNSMHTLDTVSYCLCLLTVFTSIKCLSLL